MQIIKSIQNRIYELRGERVILDFDLAILYEVQTKVLNQSVKRNIKRFPIDFMFRLNNEEWDQLKSNNANTFEPLITMRSQIVTASQNKRNTNITPYAFTEQGIAMLSGILNSDKAIAMNIAIMRAFVDIKKILIKENNILLQLKEIKERISEHDIQLNSIYDAMENMLDEKVAQKTWENRERIGFKSNN